MPTPLALLIPGHQSAPTIWQGSRDRQGIARIHIHSTPTENPKLFNPPADYEWGYAGAGPSRLANHILLHHTRDKDLTLQLQYDFTQEIISKLPYSSWTVTSRHIQRWLNKRQSPTAREKEQAKLAA